MLIIQTVKTVIAKLQKEKRVLSDTTKLVGHMINAIELIEKSPLKKESEISFEVDSRYRVTFTKIAKGEKS